MATAHSLSVVTNSCVKSPVNPKTGLSATVDQRTNSNLSHTWTGRDADYDDPREEWDQRQVLSRSVNFDTTNIETLASDLSGLSDEEFYNRLRTLKAEHKKTLQMCENLYNEKLSSQHHGLPGYGTTTNPYTVTATGTRNGTSNGDLAWTQPVHDQYQNESFNKSLDTLTRSFSASGTYCDNVRDMSAAKPPTGKPKTSDGTPNKSMSRKNKRAWAGKSTDGDYWQVPSTTSTDGELSEEELRISKPRRDLSRSKTQDDSASRIEGMWDDFSVDEYAPRTRGRSNSLSRLNSSRSSPSLARKQQAVNKSTDWRHKITIPQPFNMTLREATKEKKKTRAMEELEAQREENLLREEAECQKKFKAKPVPAHIYMPLYDELMEEQEERRRYIQTVSAQKLKETQKPFKFSKREEEIRKERHAQTNPMSVLQKDKEKKKQFKANPYPSHIFDDTITEKIKEEEEYRQIRMQMRKEELLQSSSLPPNMAARGKDYTDGKSRHKMYAERARKAGITVEHKFQPRVNEAVPDFEEMHRQFLREMGQTKQQREATVCKPFNLRTSQMASSRSKIYEDIERDEESLRENRWPFKNPRARTLSRSAGLTGSWASSLDTIPAKMTASADLRASANKARIQQQIERDLAKLEVERKRRLKEKHLKKSISEKAAANDQSVSLRSSSKTKLKEYKQAERERAYEYRRQLNEMEERVGQRPLLFERAMQVNAQHAAERRYRDTLRRAGVDEDFVVRKSSGAGRLDDEEDEEYGERSLPISDHDSDHESYSHSRRSYRSQSRSHSAQRDYSDDFDRDSRGSRGDRTDEEHSDIEEDY